MDQSQQLWPMWAIDAQRKMEACGIPTEVILTKAILLGMTAMEHSRNPPARWIARRGDGGGLLGITAEMLAYRWLAQNHPSAVGLKESFTYTFHHTFTP